MAWRSQARSDASVPAPVTTRNRSADTRVIVTSATMPPNAIKEGAVDHAADRPIDVVGRHALEQRQGAPGPSTSIFPNEDRSMIPTRSRTFLASAQTRPNQGGSDQPEAA